jgi:hypothetical protein
MILLISVFQKLRLQERATILGLSFLFLLRFIPHKAWNRFLVSWQYPLRLQAHLEKKFYWSSYLSNGSLWLVLPQLE